MSKMNPSPCVLVSGEAEVYGGYANVSTHGNISAVGPRMHGFDLPISGNANVYPALHMAFGVSPNAQLQITLPSTVTINTLRLGSVNATTDTSFDYRQLFYFNQTKFTMAAFNVGYTAPTGEGLGPGYLAQLWAAQPLSANISLGTVYGAQNTAQRTGVHTTERAWSDPILFWFGWSPAASPFGFYPGVQHSFNPNVTAVFADAAYVVNRHFLLNVEYGGLGVSASGTGPLNQTLTFAATTNPRVLAATLYFLIGASNLPPQPPAPASTPAPVATSQPSPEP